MGRRYQTELERLDGTYDWARTVEIESLLDIYAGVSLLAVGSGGSYSSAVLAAYLHGWATGRLASAVTPLEIVHSPMDLRRTGVLFLTAGGGNPDVLGAFKKAAICEPAQIGVFCMKKNSSLVKAARLFSGIDVFEFCLPTGKDGFLATNSLLATSVLVARAYESQQSAGTKLPETLSKVAYHGEATSDYLAKLEDTCRPIWTRETLVVLYGPSSHVAAVDLESKFTEAALGHVQLADYRNFAHGRHHWLARNGKTSAVLGFLTDDVRDVAEKTLRLFPSDIPVARIDLGAPGPTAAIGGIVNTLQLVGLAGKSQGFDPGRPHVPEFGRKIYHLNAFPTARRRKSTPSPAQVAAIDRKLESHSVSERRNGQVVEWREAYQAFVSSLEAVRFGALVCDYDSTLCDPSERFTGPLPDVINVLKTLLKSGIPVGVVSGRGTSLRHVFREHLDRRYWKNVILGYYNGADIGQLDEDEHPNNQRRTGRQLAATVRAMSADRRLNEIASVEARDKQVSVIPHSCRHVEVCWELVHSAISSQSVHGVRALRSRHSIDVIAPGVSKRNLVAAIRRRLSDQSYGILCIGDRGRWPGNDAELLQEPCALSVDEVSSSLDTCWNLASPGSRHVDALLEYFRRFEIHKAYFCFRALHGTTS